MNILFSSTPFPGKAIPPAGEGTKHCHWVLGEECQI